MDNLTEEQKKKIWKLIRANAFKAFLNGVKSALLSIVALTLIFVLNAVYVQNKDFLDLSTIITFVLIFGSMFSKNVENHDKMREEIEKIRKS